MKECKHCGISFSDKRKNKIFCSKKCVSSYYNGIKKQQILNKVKVCPECGIEFKKKNRKFCSSECQQVNLKKRKGVKTIALITTKQPCKCCGKLFKPIRKSNLYCSEKCRATTYNKRTVKRRRVYEKTVLRNIPSYRLNKSMSSLIWRALKENKNGNSWKQMVPYTLDELMNHLESQFKAGMSWDNYGEWHVDHIIPRSKFSFKSHNDIEFLDCWGLHNLQPLWASENSSKSNKILC